jgi:hypothetical protein
MPQPSLKAGFNLSPVLAAYMLTRLANLAKHGVGYFPIVATVLPAVSCCLLQRHMQPAADGHEFCTSYKH